ncbi:hypothetical protein AB7M17_006918 [Bradyrhizobium sp. USDA 377]
MLLAQDCDAPARGSLPLFTGTKIMMFAGPALRTASSLPDFAPRD